MSDAIQIKNVSFTYDTLPIIQEATINIKQGDFVGIIGPNGGGKTTFLKLLMGLLTPQQGTIHIFEKPPQEQRSLISYIPQKTHTDKDFPITVVELVLLGALSKYKPWKKIPFSLKQKAQDLMKKMGIEHLQHVRYSALSGGELQRAFIARALISDPSILILDEPTANIDYEAEKKIFELLLSFQGEKTILMVSHDLNTIITQVQSIISVQHYVRYRLPEEVCKHFALGLYHEPLLKKKNNHA